MHEEGDHATKNQLSGVLLQGDGLEERLEQWECILHDQHGRLLPQRLANGPLHHHHFAQIRRKEEAPLCEPTHVEKSATSKLITGADSGIGRAAAIAFAREGADIALNYLPSEKPDAQEVIALIETAGRKAVALAGDIRDEGFCSQLVADSLGALGGLDLLVNVAGHQQARESIADITTEQFDETFKTNVYAMFWLCKAALPHMPAGAAIINTSSI